MGKTSIQYGPLEVTLKNLDVGFSLISLMSKKVDIDYLKVHLSQAKLPQAEIKNIRLNSKSFFISPQLNSVRGRINYTISTGSIAGSLALRPDKKTSRTLTEFKLHLDDIYNLLLALKQEKLTVYGKVNVDSKAQFDLTKKDLLATITALTEVSSKNIHWKGRDLDSILESYIDSKNVGLLETAGFLSLGPIGLLAAKGAKLGKGGVSALVKGETTIQDLYAKTEIKQKKLHFEDVALRTKKHRLAVKGKILLDKSLQFEDFKVAAVEKNGCPIFSQKIKGSVLKPDIGVLKTLGGEIWAPVGNFFSKISSLVTSCDPFYQGKVAHPQ